MIDTMSVISLGQKSKFRMLGPGSSSGCSCFLLGGGGMGKGDKKKER